MSAFDRKTQTSRGVLGGVGWRPSRAGAPRVLQQMNERAAIRRVHGTKVTRTQAWERGDGGEEAHSPRVA